MFNITPAQQDTINKLLKYDNIQADIVTIIGAAFKCHSAPVYSATSVELFVTATITE